jgi:hypothetical protein
MLLDATGRDASRSVFSIIAKRRNDALLRVDTEFRASVAWSDEAPDEVEGDHPVAGRVRETFDRLRDRVVADDWTAKLIAYLTGTMRAVSMRDDGRVYWVPPQHIDDVAALRAFLKDCGIDLVLAPITETATKVVRAAAGASIADEIARLRAVVADFDGKQKPSNYESRLAEFAALRDRAVLYREALSVGVDEAQAALDELEQKVEAFLMERTSTVLHREAKAEPSAVVPRPFMMFGALRFDRDDLDASRFVARDANGIGSEMLLSSFALDMPVGPALLRAERAGKDDADLALVLTGGVALAELVPSLRGFGIEVGGL